jgi:hypothetical protein
MSEKEAWNRLQEPKVSVGDLKRAVKELREHGTSESPERWAALINDQRFTSIHRTILFFGFFRQYVHPPVSLSTVLAIRGTREWFGDNTLQLATYDSKLPSEIDRSKGREVFALQPAYLAEHQAALYLVFDGKVDREQILAGARSSQKATFMTLVQTVPAYEP